MRQVRKFLAGALLALSLIFFGVEIYLDAHFAATSPITPVERTGQVYRTSLNHGAVVYLTKQERFIMEANIPAAIICVLIAYFLYPLGRKNSSPDRQDQ